jgi:hypothetical protein
MDHFKLLRDFWDFAFENPEKISPNHCALFCFIINHSNRLGRKEKLGLPTEMAKEAIGLKCYKRYIKTLTDLIDWGFIVMLEKSRNQYSSNIVALVYYDKALTKAYDKAMLMQSLKHDQSTLQSKSTIDELSTKKEELITKIDKNEIYISELLESHEWLDVIRMKNKLTLPKVKFWLSEFNLKLKSELDVKQSKKDFTSHFSRWLPGEIAKEKIIKEKEGKSTDVNTNPNNCF